MKNIVFIFLMFLLGFAGTAYSEDAGRRVEALSDKMFVVVKDRGFDSSAVELFRIENGKIQLVDAILVKEDRVNLAVKFFRFEKIVEDPNLR